MSLHQNGTPKISPVKRSYVEWYPEKQLDVIGIDFGTSTLALAYKVNGKVNPLYIQEECTNAYVPTVLLVMKNGHVEVGDRALQQYCRLESITDDCIFFERVKLHLQHDKTVSLETKVKGSNEEFYYVVEVIALILREVRRKLANYFERRGGKYSLDNFHWVLTVPALWGEKARDMMREAAFMAGLCSNNPKWDEFLSLPLKPSRTHKIASIKELESHPERLSLVYEPDAAAMWCKQLSDDDVKTIEDATITAADVTTDNFFLTIDVGGGTIDVTAHQVLEHGRMKRINIPHGEVFGGTIVNQAFQDFLEKEVVCDIGFTRYLSGPDQAENKAELLGLVYEVFEKTKKLFADRASSENAETSFMVQLPLPFATTYRASLEKFINDRNGTADIVYKKRTQKLQISRSKMSSFFAPNIAKLHECIHRARDAVLAEYGDKFDIFYLVGGFGGCNLIAEEVRNKYSNAGGKVKVLVPQNHDLAVVKGACVYYDHQILSTSDATYGIGISMTYDPLNEIHVKGEVNTNDEGVKKCRNLFQPIIHNGQELVDNEVYMDSYTPTNKSQRRVSIRVYSTEEHYVNFVSGEDGKKLKEVAQLKVDVSDGLALPRNQREIQVLLDFTGIEIKIFARFKHNGKRVNACIDFLSTLNKFDNI